ncbi:MAG: hypothetical protein H6751_14350 [Candidatus Omnitrophica bacterium]|nr:hypothetical protein [Candidatus Omnitrophota bacterium]
MFNGANRTLIHSLRIPDETPTDGRETTCHRTPDLDGDEVSDIVLFRLDGSRWLHLFSGRTGEFITSFGPQTSEVTWFMDVELIPDINGDDYPEMCVVAGDNRIRIFDLLNKRLIRTIEPPDELEGPRFRASITGFEDFNNNGTGDFGIPVAFQYLGRNDYRKFCIYDGGTGELLNIIGSPQGESNEFANSIVAGNVRNGSPGVFATTSNTYIHLFDPNSDWPISVWPLPDRGYDLSSRTDLELFPDLNGDGVPEVLYAPIFATVGSPVTPRAEYAGRVFILLSSPIEQFPAAYAVVDKSVIVFPEQIVGKPSVGPIDVILTNSGPGALYFDDKGFELVGPHTKDFKIPSLESRSGLPAGGTRTLRVNFNPTDTGLREAEMVIHTNSVPRPDIHVTLRGFYSAPPPRTKPGILYVSKSGSNFSGESWKNAYTTISRALKFSLPGDRIWVQKGDYPERISLKSQVGLFGGFQGDESEAEFSLRDWVDNQTRLDGKEVSLGDSLVVGNEVIDGTLDGFVISGGESKMGGGVRIGSSQLSIRNCRIEQNSASRFIGESYCYNRSCLTSYEKGKGGGLAVVDSPFVSLINCEFSGNRAAFGGAVYLENSIAHLDEVTYRRNFSTFGGAIGGVGALVRIDGCRFEGQTLDRFTLGVNCYTYFGQTTCRSSHANPRGEWIYIEGESSVSIYDSIWVSESPESTVSKIQATDSSLDFNSCTIAPTSPESSLRITLDKSHLTAANTIIHSSTPFVFDSSSTLDIDHSLLGVEWPGEGNLVGDPLFIAPEKEDFRLRLDSPAIDRGGPYDGSVDLAGNTRPVDIPGIGSDGTGTEFDIGAYERPINGYYEERFLPFNNPKSDIDGDGKVDLSDLYILLEDWGTVSGGSQLEVWGR